VNLVIFALLARYFNVASFGIISFLMVLINLISICIDLGYRLLIVRELSVKKSLLSEDYLFPKFLLKLIVTFFITIIILIYSDINDYWGYSIPVIISLVISGLFHNLSNSIFAIFQSFNKYKLESFSLLVMVIALSINLVISRRPDGIPIFFYGYAVSMIVTFIFAYFLLNLRVKSLNFENVNLPTLSYFRKELTIILPFASIIVLEALNSSFDIFFVERFCSDVSLGEYSTFIRLVAGLTVFATIISSASMPMISRATTNGNIKSLKKLVVIYLGMIISGVCTFFLYFVFNEQVVEFLLGESYLFILDWDKYIFILTFSAYLRILPGIFLVTYNKEKARSYLNAIVLVYGVIIFYFAVPGFESDIAVKTIVHIKIVATIVLLTYFSFLVYSDIKKKKLLRVYSSDLT